MSEARPARRTRSVWPSRHLRLGRAHLQHVVFLVISDDSLFVGPLKHQIRGILGLPVLRALGRVGIAANGDLRIEPGRTAKGPEPVFRRYGADRGGSA